MSFSKIVGSAAVGNILEYYDFTLFVFLAPHISPLFFPANDPIVSIIAGLGVYALGYFMRPLGAILFGYIGDIYGRKQALTLSIMMMGIPTFFIGCLPTYQTLGLASPILLTLFRLFQGLCVGGEYNGASIFSIENVQKKHRALAGSFITSSSALGALLGSSVAALIVLPVMPPWAWRVAFIIGSFLALIGLFIRLKIMENNPITPQSMKQIPFLEALKHHPRSVFCTMGVAAFTGITYNLTLTYTSIFLKTFKHWTLSQSLGVVSYATILYIVLNPIVGKFTDKIGVKRMMMLAIVGMTISIYPVFLTFSLATSLASVLLSISILVILTSLFHAPVNVYMASLFPLTCRYSGVALSYSTAMALFGGTTSMILTFLTHWTGTPLVAILYVLFGASIAFFAILKSPTLLTSESFASLPIKNLKARSFGLLLDPPKLSRQPLKKMRA